ncbi:hypothetical protein L0128_17215 [candidate division KSB1 bacterium]|nr:hypothetical protein [candidate division KSB1 bacterium]
MEMKEHFYHDNPQLGPADAQTTLKDVAYFLLGNGLIEAAIQFSPSGAGTTLGLLVMHPEKFGAKREALSFDTVNGLAATLLEFIEAGQVLLPRPGKIQARWCAASQIPTVIVDWYAGELHIRESFDCPDREQARLRRRIQIENQTIQTRQLTWRTGVRQQVVEKTIRLEASGKSAATLEYCLNTAGDAIAINLLESKSSDLAARATNYWNQTVRCDFGEPILNQLFSVAKYHLPANISQSGRMDASIWQYNLEWVRDQSQVVIGLTISGQFELARTLLERMLQYFVTPEGDTVDSSRTRPPAETELDQNGVLLYALKTYLDWTGDFGLIQQYWPKIKAAIEFPLQPIFRHEASGLLHNQRESWERHAAFGIEDGMELTYQIYVIQGLKCAAQMARRLNQNQLAESWEHAATKLTRATFTPGPFALIDDGHLIKRRRLDGAVQTQIQPPQPEILAAGVPLSAPGVHYLNPDATAVLPMVLDLLPDDHAVAQNTRLQMEQLWNLGWTTGGYSRYHISSEPDSPGPWPLTSLIIAQAYLTAGDSAKVWRVLNWLYNLPGGAMGTWFEFYGPRPIPPLPQVGMIPWAWAEFLKLSIQKLLGVQPDGDRLKLRPRLLTGLELITAQIRLRDFQLKLEIEKIEAGQSAGYFLDGQFKACPESDIDLPMPKADTTIRILSH